MQITCREDNQEHLLAELAIQELDVVLSDTPIGPPAKVRAYNHLLGECGMTFFATRELSKKYSRGFPKVLDEAPLFFQLTTQPFVVRWINGLTPSRFDPLWLDSSKISLCCAALGKPGQACSRFPRSSRNSFAENASFGWWGVLPLYGIASMRSLWSES